MMAGIDPPSRIESAISSPSAGANLNPCPEQALITVTPGSSRTHETGPREIADWSQVGLANLTVDGVRIDVISLVVPAELDAASVGGWKAVTKTPVRRLADEDRKALRRK